MQVLTVSGFTFVKNGISLGFPIKESIESIEPLCDEIVINVGFEDQNLTKNDGTWEYLRDHFNHPKFKFIKSYWDPSLTSQGIILSQQTNIALEQCKGKICQYIQADEVIHEEDLPVIHDSIITMLNNSEIEGLVFNYLHFYGNVNIIKKTRNIYKREVRTIRNGIGAKSWLDAQGFKLSNGQKLNCIPINARIFHYGWARQEQLMKKKIREMDKLYHGEKVNDKTFQYQRIWGLHPFNNSHPRVMKEWVEKNRNNVELMQLNMDWKISDLRLIISDFIESLTNYRIGEYKNYKLLKNNYK